MKKRVLILCTGNSCRSQLAEGFWRQYGGDDWDIYSAGLMQMGVHRLAIQVMNEIGIDISGHTSNLVDEYRDQPFDMVVTVCANADRECPTFPGDGRREHWEFDDPAGMLGSDAERLAKFRHVRDQIGEKIRSWLAEQG